MKRKRNHEALKKNQSSTQVLKTLLKLMEDNYTMSELIRQLNASEQEPVFNNSVISKYINTCRYCGIKIPKIHNRYFVASIPFGMNISDKEYELLQSLQQISAENLPVKINKSLNDFMVKLGKYSNKQIARIEEETFDITKSIFQKAIDEEHKVRLMFKTGNVLDCIPVKFVEYEEKTGFKVIVKDRERTISSVRLSGIELLREKFKAPELTETVIFKVTGNLASRYDLRPNETIIHDCRPEYIIVSNRGEKTQMLLSRLMRYGNLCEVQCSKKVRADMKKIIDNTLANYGE